MFEELSVDDTLWSFQEYDVSELADGGANIRIRFSLESDGFLQSGGWTIDDVSLVMPPHEADGGSRGLYGCGCSLAATRPSATGPLLLLGFVAIQMFAARRAAASAKRAGSGSRLSTRWPGFSKSKK